MPTAFWAGGGAADVAQVDTATVTAVSPGGTLTATINNATVTYTCVVGDTIDTAAANWQALLDVSTIPEFGEIAWTVDLNVVTATAQVPGTPFDITGNAASLTFTAAGGATVVQTGVVKNVSANDVNDAHNWRRSGVPGNPQGGDDVVIAESDVDLLWNLDKLASGLRSLTRWQTFTGQIGLPVNNPLGYYEWRASYLFAQALTIVLGCGPAGNGPTMEQYDLQSEASDISVYASGSPQGDYQIQIRGGSGAIITVVGASVGVAMEPGETAAFASATVDGGGTLCFGPGATVSGAVVATNGTVWLNSCAPGSVTVQSGSSLIQQVSASATSPTYAAVTAKLGSVVTWMSGATITSLSLSTGSLFDKSQNLEDMTITNCSLDADSCQIVDPSNSITFTNPVTLRNAPLAGPFVFGTGRSFTIV